MARCKTATWLTSVAAALALTACGVASTPEAEATAEVETTEAPAAEPTEPDTDEPDDNGSSDPGGGGDGEDADPPADTGPDGDTGSDVPWHLLPEDDRPQPVDQPDCDAAGPTPVAC
jgi:hypothetical protein